FLKRLRNPHHEVTVAVIGEFADTRDAYKSTYEALDHAGVTNEARVRIRRIPSRDVLLPEVRTELEKMDAILVSGSFGESEIEGKIETVRIAREKKIPFLGIGLGMQAAVIEFARNVLNLEKANSTEYDKDTHFPVVRLLEERRNGAEFQSKLKIGADTTVFKSNSDLTSPSLIGEAYKQPLASERFRHRYEFNNQYRDQWDRSVMQITATSSDGMHVYGMEQTDHPWFVGVQYHPEFKSQPTKSHPLFASFIAAAITKSVGK
ncbi:MAG: glutamine amidotransferase-related protein, partial [Thermoguttaceae bacterium]